LTSSKSGAWVSFSRAMGRLLSVPPAEAAEHGDKA
jgi:hypothetical protein